MTFSCWLKAIFKKFCRRSRNDPFPVLAALERGLKLLADLLDGYIASQAIHQEWTGDCHFPKSQIPVFTKIENPCK